MVFRDGMERTYQKNKSQRMTAHEPLKRVQESFPYYDLIKNKTSLNPDEISNILIRQRLTLKDAHLHIGPYCFELRPMIDEKQSEMKRFKKYSADLVLPTQEIFVDQYSRLVSKKVIKRAYSHLNPKKERACGGRIVIKGVIISLVRTLDHLLIHSGENDFASEFDKPGFRHQVIAEWVNWVFKYNYDIKATYNKDQIRQMLKLKNKSESENKNKYSGRFSTSLIEF